MLMSSSSPLAAETHPSATRSFEPATTVAPDETVTVTITAMNYAAPGRVTETIPAEFTFVDGSLTSVGTASISGASDVGAGTLIVNLIGASSISYQVTAPSTEGGPHDFGGFLTQAEDATEYTISDDSGGVTVSTGPPPTEVGPREFDVVPVKAVKGAVVSGLNHPIGSNPLEWDVSDVATGTLVSIANEGIVGDFQVKDAGSGIFRLEVMTSGAPSLSGSQSINVALSYDDDTTVNLTGDINEQDALTFTNSPFDFTISQAITAGTPIGAFDVDGDVVGEYLDGIVSGDDSGPFEVRDSDMALVYKGGSLEVKTYNLDLTVSGDAGMANRTIIEDVMVTVTASNLAPTAPDTFTKIVEEDAKDVGLLVSAGEPVGDASDRC